MGKLRECRAITIVSCLVLLFVSGSPAYSQIAARAKALRESIRTLTFAKASICEALANPDQFDGKPVEIHARYSGTWEGAWLSDNDCEGAGELVMPFQRGMDESYARVQRQVARQFGIRDVVRNKEWQEFDAATRKLSNGMVFVMPNGFVNKGEYDYITANFAGVLVIKRNFRVKNGFGNGWGHLGMSRFLLVVRSVSDLSPHPL